jgi:ribosomal protein L29
MKKNDLTTRNAAELHTMLAEARAKIAQLRFDLADKKLKRTSDILATRRQIARILTALTTTT